MSGSGPTRSKEGVPQWDGDSATFQDFEEQSLQWEQSVAWHKRYLCGPKLIAELSGPARKHVTGKRPDWVSYDGGVTHLLRHLRDCLGRPAIPEMTEHLNRYFRQSRRKRFETMNAYVTRKTETYHRARQALSRIQQLHERHSARPQRQWHGTGIVVATRHGSHKTQVLTEKVKPGKQENKKKKDGTMQKPKHERDHRHTRLGAAWDGLVLTTPIRG